MVVKAFGFLVAVGPESSSQLPGYHAEVGLGRGSVKLEQRIVVAPSSFSDFLIMAEAAISWWASSALLIWESFLETQPTAPLTLPITL